MGGTLKVKEVIRRLEEDNWYQVKAKGGHRQFKHPSKPGRVTVPGKLSDNLSWDTQQSIFRQAGWKT